MEELEEQVIKKYFQNTTFDTQYYDYFSKLAKKCFEELELSEPNIEKGNEDKSNVDWALKYAKERTQYYIKEIIKGHSVEWADSWADHKLYHEAEDDIVRTAYMTIKDKDEANKELDIYLKEQNDDPIFYKRYKYLFKERDIHIKEQATNYCMIYHGCKKCGKSDYYAHAYAEAESNGSENTLCDIYAKAYELARVKQMEHWSAAIFGEKCIEAKENGYIFDLKSFIKQYHENWQIGFYQQLIETHIKHENKHDKEELIEGIKKEIAKIMTQFEG